MVRSVPGWLVALSLAQSCTRSPGSATQPSDPSGPVVETVRVSRSTLDIKIRLPGELRAYEEVSIFPKVSGFVKSIRVDRGSHVSAGDEIAELEAPELASARAEAHAKLQAVQAQLAGAEAKLAADEGTYHRLQAASRTEGVVAGNDLRLAEKAVEADRAHLRAQRDTIDAAQQALQALAETEGYLRVKAPFDGVVTERNLHPGALVGPAESAKSGVPMLRIATLSRLRLDVPVPEAFAAGVLEGARVKFAAPSFPGRTFEGVITRISHSVEVKTRTMPVELDVSNQEEELAPGTFTEVLWPVHRTYPTLFVPASAVATTPEKVFVVRIRNEITEWVEVKTGPTSDGRIEVFGHLREGDAVAKRGTDELRPGTRVTAKPTGAAVSP